MASGKIRKARSYRWVSGWLSLGAFLSLLLLANSFRDYRVVSRLLATQQIRRQMRQDVAEFEQQVRRSAQPGSPNIDLLRGNIERSGKRPVWILLRTPEGRTLGTYGSAPPNTFSLQQVTDGFRTHEPVFELIHLPAVDAVMEAFAVYLSRPLNGSTPAVRPLAPPSLLIVELAMPLTAADPKLLEPQRWNLFVNCAGALALLSTVLISGFSLRSFIRGRLLEQQVEIAREVQARLLPSLQNGFQGVAVAAEYKPAEQVGGDFYDVFSRGEHRTAMVIGDVSGKGIPAALLMGVVHGAVRCSQWTDSREHHEHETDVLNRLLCEGASGERYATMFWAYFDAECNELRYVNCGQSSPLILSEAENKPTVLSLDPTGPVIGLLPSAAFPQAVYQARSGDLLVMYSDGVAEATNSSGEEYGTDRLRSALLAAREPLSAENVRLQILQALEAFIGPTPLSDDLTLVVVRLG